MSGSTARPAESGDLDAVAALAKARPFTAGWSRRSLAEELGRADGIFLVLASLGYLLARVIEDECRLLDIAVAEDGKGRGRALLEALQAAAKDRKCRRITLEVSVANQRALAFYKAAGAEVVGCRKKFYNDGSDALLMDLNLA